MKYSKQSEIPKNNWIQKILKDTLINPKDGKVSRKSITALVSFGISIIYGPILHIVFFSIGMKWEPIEWVFFGFLGLGGGTIALTVIDKMKLFGGKGSQDPVLESETP